MSDKSRKEFLELFHEAFEGLIIPALESLRDELKSDISGLSVKYDQLRDEMKAGFQGLENRLDSHALEQSQIKKDVATHDKQIKKLESQRVTA